MKSHYIVFPDKLKVDIKSEDLPKIGDNQLLCKSAATLISIGTELRCLRGEADPDTNWSGWVKYPFRPGYCTSAVVVETGSSVTEFKQGDLIATQNTHCQYFIDTVGNPNLMKVPAGVSAFEAAWQPLGCITQLGARRAEVKLGDTIGVIGLGMLGQLVTQYLRASGARKIIAIDMNSYRLEWAKKNGATHTFQGEAATAGEYIRELTDGRMLDTVFEITGLPSTLAGATPLLRRRGNVVLLGDNTRPSLQNLGPNVVSDSIGILGIHGSMCPDFANEFNPWTWKEMGLFFFDLILDGRMKIAPMNTDIVSPLDAEKVYNRLQNDHPDTFGVLFDWSKLD